MLRQAGCIAMSGQIVDASLVAAPRQRIAAVEHTDAAAYEGRRLRDTDDEKKAIKQGRIPPNSESVGGIGPHPARAKGSSADGRPAQDRHRMTGLHRNGRPTAFKARLWRRDRRLSCNQPGVVQSLELIEPNMRLVPEIDARDVCLTYLPVSGDAPIASAAKSGGPAGSRSRSKISLIFTRSARYHSPNRRHWSLADLRALH